MPEHKQILKHYSDLKQKVKDIEQKIKAHESKAKKLETEVVCDAVTGSRYDLSYGVIKIDGIAQKEINLHWDIMHERKEQLERIREELEALDNELEDHIEQIEESELRRIARYRYMDCYTWQKVARMMGRNYTDDSCRAKIGRYLQKSTI